jgi:predicted transcriptional regulator
MDISKLVAVGLTNIQAEAYAILMENGEIKPPLLVKELKLTRTNAYKILDRLVELGLANKSDENKKFVYRPTNPTSLSGLTDQYRAEATAREEAANNLIHDLLDAYYQHSDKPTSEVFSGKKDVIRAYQRQINLREDIYFIRTKTDIAAMGFDTMHEIRVAPERNGTQRFGILGTEKGTVNHANHERSNLTPTIMDAKNYTAPVEWSVTDSSLLIVSYAKEPHAILIVDSTVAMAFKQLWTLLNGFLKTQPVHQQYKTLDA